MSGAPAWVRPALPVDGDPRHGVVRYGVTLADAVDAVADGPPAPRATHLQFTDRLWGASPDEAAARFEAVARRTPATVTLHDVPQPSDGAAGLPRRAAAYRRVAHAARGVVVHSAFEAELVAAHTTTEVRPTVIPHFVAAGPARGKRPAGDGTVAVLGWIYPGKGHEPVLRAAAALGGSPVVALGAPAPGHEADVAGLCGLAAVLRVPFSVTGFLDDAELLERLRAAAVPVTAHEHVSASGSVASWIAAGRRPLVPDGPYARELAALRPGTITTYEPRDTDRSPQRGTIPASRERGLAAALRAALADPDGTWLAPGASPSPTAHDAARAYLAWWGTVAW